MIIRIVLVLFIFSNILNAQTKFTLEGKLVDSKTGETLIGVSVFEESSKIGTHTDADGKYLLKLTKGIHTLTFRYIGYETFEKEIDLNKNTILNIKLKSSVVSTEIISVLGDAPDHNVKSTDISVSKLHISQIEKIPVIMGETDIFKTIQLLPGINSIAEGRSGFLVRGSGVDQNLILMDGMPLYYSSHMQGLYSVFNSDAVERLDIYKGGIPAHFGGRGASVLDVRMVESNAKEYHAKLNVGLITSKFSLQAPLVEDKLSLFLAGRTTKLSLGSLHDEIVTDGNNSISGKGSGVKGSNSDEFTFFDPNESWFDLNGKIIYEVNENHSLYLTGFMGVDSAMTAGGLTEWGNRAAHLRWRYIINEKILSNTSLIYSSYYTEATEGIYKFHSGIKTSSFKQDFLYSPNNKHDIRFGITSEYQDFNHGDLEDSRQNDGGKFMPPMQGLESAAYISDDFKINSILSAYIGLRYSIYNRLGPGNAYNYDEESNEAISSEYYSSETDIMNTYSILEPRLTLTTLLSESNSLKFSYNRSAQYMRLMTLGAELQWYDIWMPSTKNIEPMVNDQVAIGYFQNFFNNELQFSIESYYKWINGASDFEDGLHNYLVDNLEAYVATGIGRSYGIELSVEKPRGKFTGRISYNFGKSEQKIDVINKGRWYPFMFDKTHNLTAIASYEIIKNLTLSTTFLYSTGRPVTYPEHFYYVSGIPFPYWEGRNKYRLPDYHRLDFGIIYEPDFLAMGDVRSGIQASFYNVYNRRNIYTVDFVATGSNGKDPNGSSENNFTSYARSTFGFMPSFQIYIKF